MRVAPIFAAIVGSAFTVVAGEHSPYAWSSELPSAIVTNSAPSKRTAVEVDAFFGPMRTRRSLEEILAAFGRPESFTRQALYSATEGAAQPQPHGGTVRFILAKGGQLLIRTGDFHEIYEAIRYDKRGRATLLWK